MTRPFFQPIRPNARVQAEMRRALRAAMPANLGGNALMAGLLSSLVGLAAPGGARQIWFVCMLAQFIPAAAYWWLRVRPPVAVVRPHIRLGAAIALFAGCCWGAGAGVLFATGQALDQVAVLFVVAGLGMGGVYTMGHEPRMYFCFVYPAVVPLSVMCLVGDGLGPEWALMCVLYLAIVSWAALAFHATLARSFALSFENADLAAELQIQRDAAQSISASKTHFIAAASHDLRQPLNALALNLYALKSASSGKRPHPAIENAQASVENLAQLLNGLLDTARLDTGVMQARPAAFDLIALLRKLMLSFAPLANRKGLDLRLRAPAQVSAFCDQLLLERVLLNLIDNALRYTESGGVLVALRRKNGAARLEVWDTGSGMGDPDARALFLPYVRGKVGEHGSQEHHAAGVGLGLTIALQHAQALGADLVWRSRPGQGSRFSFALPLSALKADDLGRSIPHDIQGGSRVRVNPQTSVPNPDAEGLAPATEPVWMVLVEDDLAAFDALALVLRSRNWGLSAHRSAGEAKAQVLARPGKPFALVVDFQLDGADGMNGMELIAELREQYNDAGLPALLMSGVPGPQLSSECEREGVTFMAKPLNLEAILNWASSSLNKLSQTAAQVGPAPSR